MPKLISAIQETGIEIVSTFSSGPFNIEANDQVENWQSVGSFFINIATQAKLEIVGYVSEPGLTGYVRVYDISDPGVIIQSETIVTTTSLTKALSRTFTLEGNRVYQLQARCDGPIDDVNRFIALNVTPIDP